MSVGTALALYLAALAAQRLHELRLSARNARRLLAGGAVEHAAGQLRWLIGIHAAMPLALIAEVALGGARPPAAWPLALAALALAAAMRAASMIALGRRWTARVLVVPGEPRVTSGIYRWIAHPSYLAAAIELAAGPLLFGAWRTAIAVSLVNAPLALARIRSEQRALAR
jgi:methyltransferase